MGDFDELFKLADKGLKKDAYASMKRAGDITLGSYVPFGILTGLPELDLRMGRPGWPAGRPIEVYGFEHCGKTSLALHAIAQAQKVGGAGVFIDTMRS